MRYFMIVMGTFITLLFLLAILTGAARASEVMSTSENTEPTDSSPLIYLLLVGGAALLAGGVWLGALRRVHETCRLVVEENRTSNSG
jgi:hypothetical protein